MDKYEKRRLRLEELVKEYCNNNASELARIIEKTPSYVSRMLYPEGKKGKKRIGEDTIEILADKFNKSLYWLNGDNDPEEKKIESNAEIIGTFEEWDSNTPLRDDEVEVPFLKDVELSAGGGSTLNEDHNGFKLRFAKSTLKRAGVPCHAAVCVIARGNSMEPVLPNGATVGIDISKTDIVDGRVYAINHKDEIRIKILFRLPEGRVRLRSYNRDDWADEDIAMDEIIVVGRMFWSSVLYN